MCSSMSFTASPILAIFSAASSGISRSNASSNAMTSSTLSRLSAPRSSMKLASAVTFALSTPRCSTTMSATLNAFMLYQGLKQSNIYHLSKSTKIFIGKLILSASVMALVVYQLSNDFDVWLTMTLFEQISQLVLCISVGCLTYFIVIFILGVRFKDFKVENSNEK